MELNLFKVFVSRVRILQGGMEMQFSVLEGKPPM